MQGPVIAGSQGDPNNNGKSTMEHTKRTRNLHNGDKGRAGCGIGWKYFS